MLAMYEAQQILRRVPEYPNSAAVDQALLLLAKFVSGIPDNVHRGSVLVACACILEAPQSGQRASHKHKMGRAGYSRVVRCGRYRIAYEIQEGRVVFQKVGLESTFYGRV